MSLDMIYQKKYGSGDNKLAQNPEDDDDRITEKELDLMKFLVNNGLQIYQQYFKELINIPHRDAVDEYIEAMYFMIYCFIDTSQSVGSMGQEGTSLQKIIF